MGTDSAASGTALMCGAKTFSSTIGLKYTMESLNDCPKSLTERQKSILDYSQEAGKFPQFCLIYS